MLATPFKWSMRRWLSPAGVLCARKGKGGSSFSQGKMQAQYGLYCARLPLDSKQRGAPLAVRAGPWPREAVLRCLVLK